MKMLTRRDSSSRHPAVTAPLSENKRSSLSALPFPGTVPWQDPVLEQPPRKHAGSCAVSPARLASPCCSPAAADARELMRKAADTEPPSALPNER